MGYGLWPYPSLGTYGEVAFAGLSARALTTAGAVNTGIGLAVNGTFQLASDKPFDFIDFGVAGATAFATTGTSFLPTLYINTLGAYGGSVVKWENLTASMAGASLGTLVGFPLGKGTEQILTRYLGQSMTTDSIGAFASSIGQEYVGNKVKTTIEQQNK